MINMKHCMKSVLALGFCVAGQALPGQNLLEDSVNILEQWVQTERNISEAKADWEADKASMRNLIAIYEEEVATLNQTIEDAEKDTSAAEVLRNELLEQRDATKQVEEQVVDALVQAEIKIKGLQAVLPPPLQQELGQLFGALPDDPQASELPIGQRIQPIVAILTQVQKFNQVVTLVDDFREFEAGRTVQTETVYFGLGGAFYVDQANENAGIGVPGDNGWEWSSDKTLIPSIRKFVDIYRGTQQASYVDLPVSVK